MSLPRCGICGQEIGKVAARRCVHQPVVASATPEPADNDPDWLVELMDLFPTCENEDEDIDPAVFDAVISGSVGGATFTPSRK